MAVSTFIKELQQLSGYSEEEFCACVGITIDDLEAIEEDRENSKAGVLLLIKSLALMLKNKPSNAESMNKVTEAQALVVTVAESEHLADHHQTTLMVAAEILKDTQKTAI